MKNKNTWLNQVPGKIGLINVQNSSGENEA